MARETRQNPLLTNVSNQQVISPIVVLSLLNLNLVPFNKNQVVALIPKTTYLYLMHHDNIPVNPTSRRKVLLKEEISRFSFASAFCLLTGAAIFSACANDNAAAAGKERKSVLAANGDTTENPATVNTLDTALYNQLSIRLANGDTSGRWPVKAPYPKPGAI